MPRSRYFKIILAILLLIYPIIIFMGFNHLSMEITTGIVFILLVSRLFLVRRSQGQMGKMNFFILILAAILCLVALAFKQFDLIKLYPILISLGFAAVFGFSLIKNNTPIVEVIARLQDKDFPVEGVKYTRSVTRVWLAFFIFNGLASLYTYLYLDLKIWTLYNGLISYILVGLLFALEYLVRLRYKRKWGSHGA